GEITGILQGFGLAVSSQVFQFAAALEALLALEILSGLLLVAGAILAARVSSWLNLLLALLLILLVLLVNPLNRKVRSISLGPGADPWSKLCWRLGRHYRSKNLIGTFPTSPRNDDRPHLYLVAHYDSKSQRMPLVVRIALFVVVIGGSLVFAGLNFLTLASECFKPWMFAVGIGVLVCGIPLLFIDYGNQSPGAIDNASGVGLVLHLAELLIQQPAILEHLHLAVLITSAEELGLMGAQAYLQQHRPALKSHAERAGLYILNFDGIGVEGKLYLAGGNSAASLAGILQRSAEELSLPVGRFRLPGALFDHIPFAEAGCDALTLVAIGTSTGYIHTSQDTPGRLQLAGFQRTGQLALRAIEKFAGQALLHSPDPQEISHPC
ncbi:MAG: M28 family peptidase, partial [Chloroflexota bacterium]